MKTMKYSKEEIQETISLQKFGDYPGWALKAIAMMMFNDRFRKSQRKCKVKSR